VLESIEIKISEYVKDTSQQFIQIQISRTHNLQSAFICFIIVR